MTKINSFVNKKNEKMKKLNYRILAGNKIAFVSIPSRTSPSGAYGVLDCLATSA